jgi:hypothetical protein
MHRDQKCVTIILLEKASGGLLLSSAQKPEQVYYYPSGQGPLKGLYYRLHRYRIRAIIIPLDRDHRRAVLNKAINLLTPSNSLSFEFVDIHDGVREYPFYDISCRVGE